MRKIIIMSFISLDGVMQAPGGPDEDTAGGFRYGGWTVPFFDDELGAVMGEQMSRKADLLLGRKTFEIFASYWPEHEAEWPGVNDVTKYVASRTQSRHSWRNTVFLGENVADKIRELKRGDGPDLQVHGSAGLIQTLLRDDLADELWLKIFPVVLGNGKRLFEPGVGAANFKLLASRTTPRGVVVASYARDGEVKTGSFGT